MPNSLRPYTEEQIQTILALTQATREEIIYTITVSRVSMEEIISCLQKTKPVKK